MKIAIYLLCIMFVIGCSESPMQSEEQTMDTQKNQLQQTVVEKPSIDMDSVVAQLIKDEKKILDAAFDDGFRSLWVGVSDDGTPRNGFAEYVCLALKDYGVTNEVAVVKVMNQYKNVEELGKAFCY